MISRFLEHFKQFNCLTEQQRFTDILQRILCIVYSCKHRNTFNVLNFSSSGLTATLKKSEENSFKRNRAVHVVNVHK